MKAVTIIPKQKGSATLRDDIPEPSLDDIYTRYFQKKASH